MHVDPELLALLALGEPVAGEAERSHVESCPQCAGELSELRRVVTVGRTAEAEAPIAVPSPDVWARIREELAFGATLEPGPSPAAPTPAAPIPTARELHGHARLTPVAASWSAASGTAELATDDQGRRVLQVALRADLPSSGVRQAWLVHRDDPTVRQSLGILDGSQGLWTVAHSIDLDEFPTLDISQQGLGEAQHSGQTIVRGQLTLAS